MSTRDSRAVTAIKVMHTIDWLAVELAFGYLLYAGLARRSGWPTRTAAGIVASEVAIFTANRLRCPLTELAEHLGADRGSVTDIYLPQRLARNLPVIHLPLIVLVAGLHARNRLRG